MCVAACIYAYELHVCLVPAGARRGHWVPWSQRYRWLWAAQCGYWELGLSPL